MNVSNASILGLGTATPDVSYAQEFALDLALKLSPPETDDQRRQVELIYRRSGVASRGATATVPAGATPFSGEANGHFLPATSCRPLGPRTSDRMSIYVQRAAPLALAASGAALSDAGIAAAEITHLVTASCTGFSAPGWDLDLVERLGLPRTVLRTNVGFMGCHAAINTLRVADAFCRADPSARVLVCCTEICSIHFKYGASPDQVVANALFADGSAAAVVGPARTGGARIISSASRLIEDSRDQMGWSVGDHGFEMHLGIELPGTIRRHAGDWMDAWLQAQGLSTREIRSWAVHPGGPKILGAVEEALHLERGALEVSRNVLSRRGNMSSPTVLFILNELRTAGPLALPCVLLSFGPGVAAEAILLS